MGASEKKEVPMGILKSNGLSSLFPLNYFFLQAIPGICMIAWYCMYTPYFQPLPNIIFFHILVGIVRLYPIKCPILSFPIFAPLGSRTSICFHHLCLHEAGRTGDAAERGVLERHHLTVAVQTGLALELWRISPRRFRGFRWNLGKVWKIPTFTRNRLQNMGIHHRRKWLDIGGL